jgi:D-glycero-D-manno-heptose 1,7-bisphosphate phosphatase
MVMVNGSPFLYHLLSQLAEQGITRFVLLTGYLGEKISEYFSDGSQFGWSISYSHGPTDWDTGRRIWEARLQLDPQFLLLYSDNFVQFKLDKLTKLHKELSTDISLLLAPKARGNIKVSEQGRIQAYDKTRSGVGFDYVEVGYMLIERDPFLDYFSAMPNFPDFSLSTLLQLLASEQKIAGLIVLDPYHSISDPERHGLMCDYLTPKKILLIDRDGTINVKAPRGEYVTTWDQFKWIPETRLAMRKLALHGFKFLVISNQAGVARGMIDASALEKIHQNMIAELSHDGIEIIDIYVCPHHWNENCDCRKPAPGLFLRASRTHLLRMDRTIYIGDDPRDCLAAYYAGCSSIYIGDTHDLTSINEEAMPLKVCASLQEAVSAIEGFYESYLR